MANFTEDTNEDLTKMIMRLGAMALRKEKKTVFCIPIPDEIDLQISYYNSTGDKIIIKFQNEFVIDYNGIHYCNIDYNDPNHYIKEKKWINISKCTDVTRKIYEFIGSFFIDEHLFKNTNI